MDNSKRVKWIDVFRFLGIWAIYIGHLGPAAGKLYPFVFIYHVPLFFFAAGFFFPHLNQSMVDFVKKQTLRLILPYAFFSLIALTVFTLTNNWGWPDVKFSAVTFLLGIRNQVQAGSLWFIPCLYIIVVFNFIVYKLFKTKYACMLFALLALVVSQYGLGFNPLVTPSWIFNIDSALYYYSFYMLGAVLFPILLRTGSLQEYSLLEWFLTLLAIGITLMCYFHGSARIYDGLQISMNGIERYQITQTALNTLIILTVIYSNVFFAKLFSEVVLFGKLGRETLILCGTENVLKLVLPQILVMIGLTLSIPNSWVAVIFSLLCLTVSQYTVIPFLNLYFPKLVGKWRFS